MKTLRLSLSSLFTVCLISLSACETAPGLNKQFGYYIEYLPVASDRVIPATLQTLDDMQWMVISQTASSPDTTIVARNAYDVKATIHIKAEPNASTKLAVKIDPGESETLSRDIIQQVRAKVMPVTR